MRPCVFRESSAARAEAVSEGAGAGAGAAVAERGACAGAGVAPTAVAAAAPPADRGLLLLDRGAQLLRLRDGHEIVLARRARCGQDLHVAEPEHATERRLIEAHIGQRRQQGLGRAPSEQALVTQHTHVRDAEMRRQELGDVVDDPQDREEQQSDGDQVHEIADGSEEPIAGRGQPTQDKRPEDDEDGNQRCANRREPVLRGLEDDLFSGQQVPLELVHASPPIANFELEHTSWRHGRTHLFEKRGPNSKRHPPGRRALECRAGGRGRRPQATTAMTD